MEGLPGDHLHFLDTRLHLLVGTCLLCVGTPSLAFGCFGYCALALILDAVGRLEAHVPLLCRGILTFATEPEAAGNGETKSECGRMPAWSWRAAR